jgi:hypothetical protein
MNEQQLAAVKQALGALEIVRPMENPEPAVEEAITTLQSIISQDALDKMAENARELGLSYDDEPKIGCVNHDCNKCKAVQEPVAYQLRHPNVNFGNWYTVDMERHRRATKDFERRELVVANTTPPAPQPVPVKTYHDGKPWPVAPKPWVGLSEDEINKLRHLVDWTAEWSYGRFAYELERLLREKNT